ncbi:MAG TPA: CHAT domain-containing tetratricopeptide repeat protein [Myxococcaceae bacterium]|nr:CHAT domain-containing tetratricopeptide repeat protein [Myxococcaceae bacterium]
MYRQFVRGLLLILLNAACATVPPSGDPRLLEARRAFDEARQLQKEGRYSPAVPPAERALALTEGALGKSDPLELARRLDLLGTLYRQTGDFARAGPLLERALVLREATLGPRHPEVARSLHSLAHLFRDVGGYNKAEALHERALAMRESLLGPDHLDVAESLNALCVLEVVYGARGTTPRGTRCSRALAIRQATLDPHHPDVGESLHYLAALRGSHQRNPAAAESLYRQALAIREAALGPSHPDLANTLNNLGLVYMLEGRATQAEPLFQRALAIREAAFDPDHPKVAQALCTLAHVYQLQRRYTESGRLFARALAIYEKAFGLYHPDVSETLTYLAFNRAAEHDHAQAAVLYERAIASAAGLDENEGADNVYRALTGLADMYARTGEDTRAVQAFQRLHAHGVRVARANFIGLPDATVSRQAELSSSSYDRLNSMALAYPENEALRRFALAVTLEVKNRSAEHLSDISRGIHRALPGEEPTRVEHLRSLRSRIARLTLAGPGALSPVEHQRRLQALSEEAGDIESELSVRSAPSRDPLDGDRLVEHIATALPANAVLVELIVCIEKPQIDGLLFSLHTRKTGPQRYLAFLLFPDGRSRLIDLGAAEPIDRAARELHEALASKAPALEKARALHTLVFQPLQRHLGSVKQLFLAPDGQLALIPFDALHDGKRFLLDTFDITYLNSGKDLLPRGTDVTPASTVVVLADPDFKSAPPGTRAPAERSAALASFYASHRNLADTLVLEPLAGTRREAEAIRRLFPQAHLLLGSGASKDSLLGLTAPGVLHVATHGFFVDDASSGPEGTRTVASVENIHDGGRVATSEPLLRSGLVLAGALAEPSRSDAFSREHALLTALELSGMNLWGTQLVVLSACDTGRGDIRLGQGVHGLRRALFVAGAEAVVTSLWKVRDDATSLLMATYYRNLRRGQGRVSALRNAMREIRKTHPSPFFWAPFVASGRDTPLRGVAPAP